VAVNAEKRQGRGRETALTPKLQKAITGHIADGLPYDTACALVGIDYQTFSLWMRRGKGTDSQMPQTELYMNFMIAVQKAKAQAEAFAVQSVVVAYPDNWKAAAWMLERRHPDKWGKRSADLMAALQVLVDLEIAPPEMVEEARNGIESMAAKIKQRLSGIVETEAEWES
jgi:hypothetical protein